MQSITENLLYNISLRGVSTIDINSSTSQSSALGSITSSGITPITVKKQQFPPKHYVVTEECYSPAINIIDGNIPDHFIHLSNRDFVQGTYRITSPGRYLLTEDIVFSPNPRKNGVPTEAQRTGHYANRAYHMGFFTAITVECDNVLIDLQGFTLEQSSLHQKQQRFYSNIELSSSPFPAGTGPSNFGSPTQPCTNIIVRNGVLGRSAHHGIHGNNATNVIIERLEIRDAEVAAISLNGCKHLLIRHNIINHIGRSNFNSKLSQATFALPFLEKIERHSQKAPFMRTGKNITVQDVADTLRDAIHNAKGQSRNIPEFMKSQDGLSDANIYGMVIAGPGIHIGSAKHTPKGNSNSHIFIHDVKITDLVSTPKEWPAYSCFEPPTENPQTYGGGAPRTIGPVGDVFDITRVTNNQGRYHGDPLSDAQLVIAMYGKVGEKGKTNICHHLIDWSQGRTSLGDYQTVSGGDSMGHTMKGSIGIFLPQLQNAKITNVQIQNLVNNGDTDVGGAAYGIVVGCK